MAQVVLVIEKTDSNADTVQTVLILNDPETESALPEDAIKAIHGTNPGGNTPVLDFETFERLTQRDHVQLHAQVLEAFKSAPKVSVKLPMHKLKGLKGTGEKVLLKLLEMVRA